MKVAVVLAAPWQQTASIDFGGYCNALARFGHLPTLVCSVNERGKSNFPVVVASAHEMERDSFWRNLNLDVAISFNWLRAPNLVRAMKRAGMRVVSRGDSDGLSSVRVFPRNAWLTCVSPADGIWDHFQRVKHWMHRYLFLSQIEDKALLETIEHSDAVAMECKEAVENLLRILDYYRRSDLAYKFHVVPHSVSDRIFFPEICTGWRPRRVVCAGRWDDSQKDAELLAATIKILIRQRADIEIVIVGSGAADLFRLLAEKYSQVIWRGRLPHEAIPEVLATCRCILSSSRWEGYPIIALEALCMGCTVAAPPLPGFIGMAENGRYGTISPHRSARSLARAVELEMENWEKGIRASGEIAAVWRRRVSNDSVVSNLVSTIS